MLGDGDDDEARIRECLRRLDAASGPASPARARHSDFDLNGPAALPHRLRPAAVLVPLVGQDSGYTVLLTQRTDHLQHHPGQISFPGGRVEADDGGPIGAALREAHEEIGLDPARVTPLGLLDDYETVTGFLVTPVVSLVVPGFRLVLDEFEVADAFEVPLAFLMDPSNHQVHSRIRHGERRRYYVFEYQDRYIWGATAGMLMNLYRRMNGLSGPTRPPPRDASPCQAG